SLYPVITSRSFEDKAVRGARVQIGTDWQVLFNGPDLVDIDRLSGTAASQLAALKPEIAKLLTSLGGVAGVKDATYMIEAVCRTSICRDTAFEVYRSTCSATPASTGIASTRSRAWG